MSNHQAAPWRFSLFSRTSNLIVQAPAIDAPQESRVEEYRRKSALLKQIMSNKARRYRAINGVQNIATVVVSSFLLFVGFSGLDKIRIYVSWIYPASKDATELGFNLLVFLLFVIGILHLVFRFPEKQSSAEKAIVSLASLGNEIEDMITTRGNLIISEEPLKVDLIRTRYEAISDNIPANSDKEFIRAKLDLARKNAQKPKIYISSQQLFDVQEQEKIVSSVALGTREIFDVLIALRNTNGSLYLGGGLVRNAVWDYLHSYRTSTAVDDVDVIYFDRDNIEKRHDDELNAKLVLQIPNVRWSAKNQARMHSVNNEAAYISLQDAVSKWPETATAFIVRLNSVGKLEFIAPYGFDDLLRLVVTNTPAFENRLEVVRKRIELKQWQRFWPRLRIMLLGSSTSPNAP